MMATTILMLCLWSLFTHVYLIGFCWVTINDGRLYPNKSRHNTVAFLILGSGTIATILVFVLLVLRTGVYLDLP